MRGRPNLEPLVKVLDLWLMFRTVAHHELSVIYQLKQSVEHDEHDHTAMHLTATV